MAKHSYYITIDLTVKLNDKEQSTGPVFDQVSFGVSDAAYRNMNQNMSFLKKHQFPMGFRC